MKQAGNQKFVYRSRQQLSFLSFHHCIAYIVNVKDTLDNAPWIWLKSVDMLHFSPIPIQQLLFLKIWIPTICVISLFTFFYRILITLSWEKIFKVIMLKRNSDGIYPKSKLFRLPIKSFSRGKNFQFSPASLRSSFDILETI